MNRNDDTGGRARRRRWIIYPAIVLLTVVVAGLIALGQSRFWPHVECFDTPPPGAGTALSNATAPVCSYQQAGHMETLAGARMTHHYVRSRDLTWHVVTAGDRARPAVVFLHGLPESWFSFHHQMADLSRDRFVVALDVPPYGQTEKSAAIDYAYPALAARVIDRLADWDAPATVRVGGNVADAQPGGAALGESLVKQMERLQGRTLRDISFTVLNGGHEWEEAPGEIRFEDLGGDIVFVHVWATWCPPCLEKMPAHALTARTGYQAAAVDPYHDRARSRRGRCPDVQVQAVLGLGGIDLGCPRQGILT